MDFNPLDILAAAALGEKDAPPEINSDLDQGGNCSSHSSTDPATQNEDCACDANTKSDMGKSGNNCLKIPNKTETSSQKSMAPQKTPWSPDSLLQLSPEGDTILNDSYCLGDLVKDNKEKDLDLELKQIIGKNFHGDSCLNHKLITGSQVISLKHGHNNNLVAVKNTINDSLTKESSNLKLESSDKADEDEDSLGRQCQDFSQSHDSVKVFDEKSLDSGVSAGESSPETSSVQFDPWTLDHPYALVKGHSRPCPTFDSDDYDAGSDLSPQDDLEQRPHNLSVDCNYLKSGIIEGVSSGPLDYYGLACPGLARSKLPSSSSSASSPTTDLGSRSSKNLLDNAENEPGVNCLSPPSASASPPRSSPKFGKFKIGTFASFSTGNLELEKYLRKQDHTGHKKLNIGIPSEPHAMDSTLNSSAVQPLLQSPSLDWDRSEAGSETHEDSSDCRTPLRLSPDFTSEKVAQWSHPLYHDHDYCSKEENLVKLEDPKKLVAPKHKYTKRRNKMDLANHEKIKKAKYLKKELLKQDNFLKSSVEPELVIDNSSIKTNPVGRPRKRPVEKILEEEIDPETGTKLKITGKFQDQYVYYLSKSSRTTTRRRQAPVVPIHPDKIIVPPPKPGDIVVHHLTDSDIETVRLKGRGALNLPERPNHINTMPTSTLSSCSSITNQSSEAMTDTDIVSTILSMENDNLSSPSGFHAPPSDLTSTAGINLHQPALTESLRQLSGDPSITSEHVLNYLLSVVKDETLLGDSNGFDGSTSALFPSIPPDAIYSKADHEFGSVYTPTSSVGLTQASSVDKKYPSFDNTDFKGSDPFTPGCNTVGLSDDLPSFMSNSQESSTTCGHHDTESQGSLKSMFGSDISSLGAPQLSSSVPRLTSIEKTLDYLGVKDGEIKLENTDYSGSFGEASDDTTAAICLPDQQLDETPWIVTVTLYFNDVPAIMVNSQPFIRLVDIHKQILPAKDTGILKKRCQLLNIPVLNCNEMQRYFLVQYGRAYNSKSTLIVSKDQANKLVTYYATPQPRIGKGEESQNQKLGTSDVESRTSSPIAFSQSGVLKRKGLHKHSKKAVGSDRGSPVVTSKALAPGRGMPMLKEESQSGQGKRTRHKKVNYLEMLKGEEKEGKVAAEDAVLATIEAVVKSAPGFVEDESKPKKKRKSKKSRKDDSSKSEKRHKGSKSKKSSKSKKHDKKSRKHKERHSSSSRKNAVTEQGLLKHPGPSLSLDSQANPDHSQQKKSKTLKLKVNSLLNFASSRKSTSSSPSSSPSPAKKGGLFSRSNSVTQPSSPASANTAATTFTSVASAQLTQQRTLAVAHQAASATSLGESHLPSQPGDIFLNLFTRPSAACVQCRTCSQFLSVPHFMRHHHVPMDSQWLASEAAHRILVPLTASSCSTTGQQLVSDKERRLWEEFHRLQESIGGFGEGDDESDSEVDFDAEDEVDDSCIGEVNQVKRREDNTVPHLKSPKSPFISANSPVLSVSTEGTSDVSLDTLMTNSNSRIIDGQSKIQDKLGQQRHVSALPTPGLQDSGTCFSFRSGGSSVPTMSGVSSEPLVRHSSRKRKLKQLFSIENYDTTSQRVNEDR